MDDRLATARAVLIRRASPMGVETASRSGLSSIGGRVHAQPFEKPSQKGLGPRWPRRARRRPDRPSRLRFAVGRSHFASFQQNTSRRFDSGQGRTGPRPNNPTAWAPVERDVRFFMAHLLGTCARSMPCEPGSVSDEGTERSGEAFAADINRPVEGSWRHALCTVPLSARLRNGTVCPGADRRPVALHLRCRACRAGP
jgi:hypothetical protein